MPRRKNVLGRIHITDMEALEEASTNQTFESLARFLGSLVAAELKGENTPKLPN